AYQVVLLNLTAVFGSTTMQQNMQALCFINITSECSDADNDTFFSGPGCTQAILDCDDTRAGVNPNATEVCNNRDDDCDGSIDEGKVCPSSSKGGSGGGGGESSSSASSGSAAAGAASGSSAAFSNMMLRDEESFKQKEPPVEEHQPIQAQPIEYNQGQETEPKKVDFVGHLLGALVLLAAGIFLAYEHIKKKKHKRKR
ncbi:putative metal-binding motif-containing protein, partial [Candidatus Woesearchaeota archaeon]|nr:putative metal-binding motif-containing protein [Candidatus Woesearchaeota archaeon]